MRGRVAVRVLLAQEQILRFIDSTNKKLSHVCPNSSSALLEPSRCFQEPEKKVKVAASAIKG